MEGNTTIKMKHLYEEKYNNQGCIMKIVECLDNGDIVVEFQDKYKYRTNSIYQNFKSGSIKTPYYPTVYGAGFIGVKYPRSKNCKNIKEYVAWKQMLRRCFSKKEKKRAPAYEQVTCCNEWLNYENFYEWLHSQPNFDKWFNGKRWAVDKDILNKGNKVYSPDTCCLIPQNVNCLFLKREAERGDYPIGVRYTDSGFVAKCHSPFTNKGEDLGSYSTPEKAFYLGYKPYKENIIKRVAEIEYKIGNITKECYMAMMNYVVEIDD